MSPRSLITRIKECGIDWMAITDHNSFANCPAYEKIARQEGVNFTWGLEMQTAEEIHILVYFDAAEAAQDFGEELYSSLLPIDNDPEFFGDQVIIDENEDIIGMEQRALINSSLWDLSTAVDKARSYGGYCVPAHIDADVNSIISQVGFVPETPLFELLSLTARADLPSFLSQHPELAEKSFLRCSDAHYLDGIGTGTSRLFLQNPAVAELALAAMSVDGRKILV